MITTRFTELVACTMPVQQAPIGDIADAGEPFYAGESAGAVRGVQPAAEILHELCDGPERLPAEGARLVHNAPTPAAR